MAFDVIITSFRMNTRESASQVLERLFGFEPDRARALVRQFPATVIQGTTHAHAEIAAEQLREVGAKVEILERTVASAPVSVPSDAQAAPAQATGAVPVKPAQVTEPVHALAVPAGKAAEAALSASKATAATELFGSDAMAKIASAAQKLQERKATMVEAAPASAEAAASPWKLGAEGDGAAPRKVFSTVAMQSIEADLQRFEVTDFGPAPAPVVERNTWADSMPPAAPTHTTTTKSEPALASRFNLKAGKPELSELDQLFAGPPAKSQQQPQHAPMRDSKLKAESLDDMFSPPGADNYYKSKDNPVQARASLVNKDGGARGSPPRVEDKVWRPPVDKSLEDAALNGASAAAKVAGKAALKAVLTKAAAGVVALSAVAGSALAVSNARHDSAVTKSAMMASTPEGKAEFARLESRKRLHPVLRLAPNAIAPAFAGILRKQVDKTFHVAIEWDDAPSDFDCMLVVRDKKFDKRMTKLMRTGERLPLPPDVESQFNEHVETLRAARGKPNEMFENVCMSVSVLSDPKDAKPEVAGAKLAEELKDEDEDDEVDKTAPVVRSSGSSTATEF